jgi:hypothetical protein
MSYKYSAKIYVDDSEIEHNSGDDLDKLYTWLLTVAQGKFGDVSGEVIDNKTQKVVKKFRKSPPD